MSTKTFLSIASATLLFAAPVFAAGGGIAGKVTLSGKPPAEKPIKFLPECKAHGDATTTHYVVDASGGLANVLVYVKSGLAQKAAAPTEAAVIDQSCCLYHPYVLGVQVGQKLVIQNSDDTMHNVNATPSKNEGFNIPQATKGTKNEKTFAKPEVFVKLSCNVHPWMFAYVGVVENPYFAVTGADGSFKIPGLPDGEYVLAAAHPKIQPEQTAKVKVAGGEVKQDFTFKAPGN